MRWLNPLNWIKLLFTDRIMGGQLRHILTFLTGFLVADYGLSAEDATAFIESTLRILPALLALGASLVAKTQAAPVIPPSTPKIVSLGR